MRNVVPLYRTLHVLFVEDDWVIRQIVMEHFAGKHGCRSTNFTDADQALSYLHRQCGADRIFSNVDVGGRGGVDLTGGSGCRSRIELAAAPGYDAERDRFQAIDAGNSFFRIKSYTYPDLWQALRHTRSRSSCR